MTVRGLLAQPPADPVPAGERATFVVDSRGRPYRWRVRRVGERAARVKGGARDRRPAAGRPCPAARPGVYLLECRAGRWHDRGPVPGPGRRARAPILVVVPAITWFGRDKVDDDRDGCPNTLDNGGPAAWPRLLAGGPARRASPTTSRRCSSSSTAQKIRYDLTTDLTLDRTRTGAPSEREGVLLAGPLRWITPTSRAACAATSTTAAGSRRSAPTRCAAASASRATGSLRPLPPTRRPTRSATRAAPACARSATPRAAPADRGRGRHRADDRRATTLPGFTELEESDASRDGPRRVALAAVDPQALEDGAETPARRRRASCARRCALSRLGEGTRDPRRAARVGRAAPAAPARSSSSRATSSTSCAASSRRIRSRGRSMSDTAAVPDGVLRRRHGRSPRRWPPARCSARTRARARVGDARRARAHAGAARARRSGTRRSSTPSREHGRARARRRRAVGARGRGRRSRWLFARRPGVPAASLALAALPFRIPIAGRRRARRTCSSRSTS